ELARASYPARPSALDRPAVERRAAVNVRSSGRVQFEKHIAGIAQRRKHGPGFDRARAIRVRKIDTLALCSQIDQCLAVDRGNGGGEQQCRRDPFHTHHWIPLLDRKYIRLLSIPPYPMGSRALR